jgi:hypothetical protein
MRQFNLPPPDEHCLNEMRAALASWLRDRCAHGQQPARIQFSVNMAINAFWGDAMGTRANDSFGATTDEQAPAPPKRQKRVVHTNRDLKRIEKDANYRRAMAASPPVEEPKFPDTFRYRERENA